MAAEINPPYQIIVKPLFELGVDPGAGLIFDNVREDYKPIFNYGLGASAVYHFKKLFIDFESLYAVTNKFSFANLNDKPKSVVTGNLNNLRTFVKFGYKFYK